MLAKVEETPYTHDQEASAADPRIANKKVRLKVELFLLDIVKLL